MRRGTFLALAMCSASWAAAGEALVQIHTKKEEGSVVQSIEIGSALASYGLSYDITTGEGIPPGKCTSRQSIFGNGVIPLGMTSSGGPNWYIQGFVRARLDGMSLHDIPATWRVVRPGGPDAMAEALWSTPKGPVALRLAMRGGDDKLLLQLALGPETKAQRLELSLYCYPQGFDKPWDRRVITAARDLGMPATVKFEMAREPWALFFDPGMAGSRRRAGPCGLVYVPGELAAASANLGYAVVTTLRAAPGARKITLGLWDFALSAEAPAVGAALRDDRRAIADDLAAVAQADWSDVLPAPRFSETYAALLSSLAARQDAPTAFDEMTNQVVTPHEPRLRPLAGGPVRVLVVAPRWAQRDTVELAQRFDMACDTVSFESRDSLTSSSLYLYGSYDLYGYPRKTATGVLGLLRRALEPARDCMILSGFEPALLPDILKQQIAERVRAGTGLILIGRARGLLDGLDKELRPAPWHASLPVEQLPSLAKMVADGKPIGTAYTLGQGRVLALNYGQGVSGLTPALSADDPDVRAYFDYFHELVASAVLWASRRELPVRLRFGPAPGQVTIDADRPVPDAVLEVLVDHPDRQYKIRRRAAMSLSQGTSRHTFPVEGLTTCLRLVSLRVLEGDKVVGVGTAAWPASPAGPRIAAIDLPCGVLAPGGTLEGVVRVEQAPPGGSLLRLEVSDSLGRIVHRQALPVHGPETAFRAPLGQPVAPLHSVEARLECGGRVCDVDRRDFAVADREVDDFRFLVWADGQNSALSHNILRVLAEHGVDWIDNTGCTGGTAEQIAARVRNAARHGLLSIPYITRISSSQTSGRVRRPCLTDPKHVEPWTEGLRQRARGASQFGPVGYTLGDENYLVSRAALDVCTSPTCLGAFRKELQSEYGTLGALNASWKAEHKAWEDVVPATLDEVREKPELWPRWADHRLFMDRVFTAAHKTGRDAIREADRGARVGFDGLFNLNSQHGYDFYNLCQTCDMIEVYALHFMQPEYLRCWQQPGSIVGAWYNRLGNDSPVWAKRMAWYLLFHRFNSSWYWMAYQTGPALLFPDLRPTPQLVWMAESIREIKAGIGKLLLAARRLDDGIAVHYSQASVHANTLLRRSLERAQEGFCRLIEDTGLQYELLSSEQIAAGRLAEFKVLVLPSSFALTRAEVEAIRRFVARGGTLIADTLPGILDGHCRLLETGALDDLFGVSRSGLPDKPEAADAWESAQTPPRVSAHKSGTGTCAVLNVDLAPYEGMRRAGQGARLRTEFGRLLDGAGVRAPVRVGASFCEVVRFSDGPIEYVGVIRDQDCAGVKAEDVMVHLPRPAFVYDVRQGKTVGRVGEFLARLVPGDAKVFALLPYAVEGVSVAAPTRPVPVGSRATFGLGLRLAGAERPGRHCLRLELTGPDGKPAPHYARNVLTDKLSVEVPIDLALNDLRGAWQVRVTDVATGQTGVAGFRVE